MSWQNVQRHHFKLINSCLVLRCEAKQHHALALTATETTVCDTAIKWSMLELNLHTYVCMRQHLQRQSLYYSFIITNIYNICISLLIK